MKPMLRGLIVLAFLALCTSLLAPPMLHAAPSLAEKTGYTLLTSLSADPKKSDYTASFDPEVAAIYAWALVVAEGGAAEKQFTVDIQFTSPLGNKVESKWYSGDTGKVTTVSRESYDAGKWGTKNVARRQLDIAGTDNADLTGQWTVTYSVSGKVMYTENFTLATTAEIEAFTKEEAAKKELEDKGYTVNNFGTTTWSDGTIAAFVRMPMVSNTIYSPETSQQLVDGFTADRKGFPTATVLIVQLEYTERYWIRYDIKVTDWDAYVKSKDFDKFLEALWRSIWDAEKGEFLKTSQERKDFITKNFGAGTYKPPPNVDPKQGTVGSVRVQVSPATLPADGTSTAQVTATVYDKQNKAVPDIALTFTVSGTGMGTIQPKTATTDSKGQAKATYKAGTKAGTVVITVTVGKTTGTATLTLGEDKGDPAADNVRTFLAGQGYHVIAVKYEKAESYAWVLLDLGEDFESEDLAWAILHGCATLRDNYPNANKLAVAILYEQAYALVFPAKAADVDQVVAAVKAAKGDKAKINAALQRFLAVVFNNAVVLDARTGKQVGTVKDFTDITFGF
mgnify:CR=1 FL=1